jgi:hypothetical protein
MVLPSAANSTATRERQSVDRQFKIAARVGAAGTARGKPCTPAENDVKSGDGTEVGDDSSDAKFGVLLVTRRFDPAVFLAMRSSESGVMRRGRGADCWPDRNRRPDQILYRCAASDVYWLSDWVCRKYSLTPCGQNMSRPTDESGFEGK